MNASSTRVLVADDDGLALLVARTALEAGGCEVLTAEDGNAALDMFGRERPDCVILDVVMPGMNGFDACKAIRATPAGRDVPILIMTSHDDLDAVARAYDSGATDFAAKGLSNRLLIERVKFLLREHRSRCALRISRSHLRMVQDMARVGHWEVDGVGRTLHVSELVVSMLASRDGTVGHLAHLVASLHESEGHRLLDAFRAWQTDQAPFRIEAQLRTGSHLHIQGAMTPGTGAVGAPTLTLAVQDITKLRRAQWQAHRLANFDSLTGLPNRRQFLDSVGEILKSRDSASVLGTHVLRLRGLDRLQQSLGQTACDAALVETARNLLATIVRREGDAFAHLGSGEFALCRTDCDSPQKAAVIAEDITHLLATPLSGDGWTASFQVSTGIVMWPADGGNAEMLLERAQTLAARGMSSVESCYQFFAAEAQQRARRLIDLQSALHGALERGQISLAYQPKITLSDRVVTGTEALMRWTHPDFGAVAPAEFIAVAEESGIIGPLGTWALREACRQTAAWRKSLGRDLTVSVNVSAHQLLAPRKLVEDVQAALQGAGLPAHALELELTESMIIHAAADTLAALQELRSTGVSIALDDFGTGYSSLSYLRQLQVDCLKIDRSFISDLSHDGNAEQILVAILGVSSALRLRTVAEGVETPEQFEMLLRHGCREAQGYLIARPLAADAVVALLAGSLPIDDAESSFAA